MSKPIIRHVQMPPNSKYLDGHNLPLRDRVLVVIGANGCGKTRFGAWLDNQNIHLHHRVSAHRSLSFPERVQPTDLEEAERHLYFGNPIKENPAHYRHHSRWQSNPATALMNDFAPLVTVMVSESFAVSDQYRVAMKSATQYVVPPKTRMDLVKEIWEAVLPDRELVFTGSRIETRNRKDNNLYQAKEMSDGERGIFYLIGEALSVPKDGVFVVDEPELHLHRAIQARLWDAVESARPDCTFVYITHDLGFAASRRDATKVWLREYTNDKWDWEEVPESDAFPESLLLEVMGSRRPVLFVKGDHSTSISSSTERFFQNTQLYRAARASSLSTQHAASPKCRVCTTTSAVGWSITTAARNPTSRGSTALELPCCRLRWSRTLSCFNRF